jgi:hypothetical protein
LVERGFDCKEMNVGWQEWTAAGLPTEKGDTASAPEPSAERRRPTA